MGTRKRAPRGDRGRGVVLPSGEPGDLAAEGACGTRAKGWTRATLVDTSAGPPALQSAPVRSPECWANCENRDPEAWSWPPREGEDGSCQKCKDKQWEVL